MLVFEQEVVGVIREYAPQVGRSDSEKEQIYYEMASKRNLQNPGEIILRVDFSTDMLEDGLMVIRVCMVGMELAKEMLKEEDYLNAAMKRSCAWQTHGLKRRSKKNTINTGGNETEIDFVLADKKTKII